MKSLKTTLIFLSVSMVCFGQKIEFDIHNLNLKDFVKIEQELGSKLTPNTANHLSGKGIAQPLKFTRKQEGIPDLITEYFFYEKDSTIAYILYEWDVSNFEKKDNNKKPPEFQLALIEKYNSLEKKINRKFGERIVKGNLDTLSKINEKGGLKKNNKWNPNDSLEIEMYASISNYYEKRGAMTINPTHRIRLYIRSKKAVSKPRELTEERIDSLGMTVQKFMKALGEKDFVKSKECLSELIVKQTSESQFEQISETVKLDEKLELVYHGIQMGMKGEFYVIMQYKYVGDDEAIPKEVIKVVFDDKDKIIGFQPMKMN